MDLSGKIYPIKYFKHFLASKRTNQSRSALRILRTTRSDISTLSLSTVASIFNQFAGSQSGCLGKGTLQTYRSIFLRAYRDYCQSCDSLPAAENENQQNLPAADQIESGAEFNRESQIVAINSRIREIRREIHSLEVLLPGLREALRLAKSNDIYHHGIADPGAHVCGVSTTDNSIRVVRIAQEIS